MTGRMVYYAGRVQGVGFRATAVALARGWPVTGWVRNVPNGQVQLLVEGSEAHVEEFLKALREHMKAYLESERIEECLATGNFKRFDIVR